MDSDIYKNKIKRHFTDILEKRLKEHNPHIQVLLGPRQVGKTTGVHMLDLPKMNIVYESADESLGHSSEWIEEKWQKAREHGKNVVLIIDEIQKVIHWSEKIKELWDKEKKQKHPIKLVLLGSSSLSLSRGLEESLTGRFEVIPAYHWSLEESQELFKYTLDQYLVLGGYPEAARFKKDLPRWRSYLKKSIIETVIGKDILRLASVKKPALFRQTFELLSAYPAQEISYTKLLGQLQEGGNVELIKYYIELFEGAFLFKSIQKFSGSIVRQKTSSPKIIPLCPALSSHHLDDMAQMAPDFKGRLFEAVVGARLLKLDGQLSYWRDRGDVEVDYVYQSGSQIIGVEVKSGRKKHSKGVVEFKKKFPQAEVVYITLDNFFEFSKDPLKFLKKVL